MPILKPLEIQVREQCQGYCEGGRNIDSGKPCRHCEGTGYEKRWVGLEKLRVLLGDSPARPYLCPVCNGQRSVPAGFYSLGRSQTINFTETCRTCAGTGVLWGKPEPPKVTTPP